MDNDCYQLNAAKFFAQYESVSFEQVHAFWLPELKQRPVGTALDIGAGSGRDARFLAGRGWQVTAVEPAIALLALAKDAERPLLVDKDYLPISWCNDSLPELNAVIAQERRYDLILLSAVLMHLTPDEQLDTMKRVSALLAPNGLVVISLRLGNFTDGRVSHLVELDNLIAFCKTKSLRFLSQSQLVKDQLGRNDVSWQTILFTKD